jgi:hypothetical protein
MDRALSFELSEKEISCPYCGESVSLLVDESISDQSYIEDCEVCCRPIQLDVMVTASGDVVVTARTENET